MKQYIFGIALLSLISLSLAFKAEDCEGKFNSRYFVWDREIVWKISLIPFANSITVCVATIDEFAQTLTDDIKSDPKQIEEAFKQYCLTAKSKQQRLVSYNTDENCWFVLKNFFFQLFLRLVLLFGWFGNISYRNLGRNVKTIELVNAST